MGRKKPILLFEFETISLSDLNAEEIVEQEQTLMYPLLPTMKNVSADLMEQAALELSEIYSDDQRALEERFIWTDLFLKRTTTITDEKKKLIRGRLSMYSERFFEETPTGRDLRAIYHAAGREEGIQEGRQEGIQQGILEALQHSLVNVVCVKYPELASFAQEHASHFDKTETLDLLIAQVVAASSAREVRKLLKSGPTKS
jgi:hypothetical protein